MGLNEKETMSLYISKSGEETLINNYLNTIAKLLELFKRAKKDFIDVLTLYIFVIAETEKLWIE